MMKRVLIVSAVLALSCAASTAWAHGDVACKDTPKEKWKTADELNAKLLKDGWKVRRMLVSGNCYEVYGVDPNGKHVEAFFDPGSMDRVEE